MNSANTNTSLLPLLKDTYASKLKKINESGNTKKYFQHIKKYLKKKKHG